MHSSLIVNTDSYKTSQWNQYPPGTRHVWSYIESRGGKHPETVFFGLSAFLQSVLSKPVTMEDVNYAEKLFAAHGVPFNKEGWVLLVERYAGKLPLYIWAAPEGSVVPTGNVLVGVVNVDPDFYWLTSYIETALLRAVWYASTVATNSYFSKKIIYKYLLETGTPESIDFKLHDFGSRGVSSEESCAIGAAAHLTSFLGTDSILGLVFAQEYYGEECAGFSIPAMEHSTVTSWGRDGEADSFRNMLNNYAKPGAIVACVSDSFDVYNACEKIWGEELRQQVIDSGATVVIRPDSGDPTEVVTKCIQILDSKFGSVVNAKGYKVLNNVRIIQGDGINDESMESILKSITSLGYSADNIAFGKGGALLQGVNRDDQKWAMKCSMIEVCDESGNVSRRAVMKDPITDQGKRSKTGVLSLFKHQITGEYKTVDVSGVIPQSFFDEWDTYDQAAFLNGVLYNKPTFKEIRERINEHFMKSL